jgi:WD40 repeat protein/serine/threonine protein kinase
MDTTTSLTRLDDPRVVQAVHDYLEAMESGRRVDRQQFLAQHAEFADVLERCLDALHLIEDFLPHLSPADGSDADTPGPGGGHPDAHAEPHLQLGDYQIVRRIGQGGMGVVYEARQVSLQRSVALKILPLAAVLDPRALQRFHTEAVAAASLDHPHIVGIHAVGCDRGIHYYAMQYVAGRSLAELIRELQASAASGASFDVGSPSPEETKPVVARSTYRDGRDDGGFRGSARLILQAAEALEYAHQMGVVHRDIKPSNLLIDEQGKLWITDFGLAQTRGESSVTMTGDLVGTLRYMSPEQAGGQRRVLDHRTDIYSLGITLYELLALRPAFGGEDRQLMIRQILENSPAGVRKINPAIPRDLETIVQKATEKHPDSRYQTAQEMADDLQRFLDYRPILARRARLSRRGWRWVCRNRAISALMVTAASLLVMLAIAKTWSARRESVLRNVAERRNYVLSVTLAYRAFDEGDLPRARSLLQPYMPPFAENGSTGFEANHLWSKMDFIDATPTLHHGAPITDVVLSPDERIVVTSGDDGTVKLWDLQLGEPQLVRVLNVDSGGVHCVAFLRDGKTLIVGGTSSVTLWDVVEGYKSHDFDIDETVLDVAVSPQGDYVTWCSCTDAELAILHVWKVGSPEPYRQAIDSETIRSVAYSPDGTLLASAGTDGMVRTWSLHDTALSTYLTDRHVFQHPNSLFTVAFSPDGRLLAAGGYNYQTCLWDLETGEPAAPLRTPHHSVTSLAFSTDGRALITGGRDNCARIWDLASRTPQRVVQGHRSDVTAVAISHDGSRLVTGSKDGTAKLWHVSTVQNVERGPYKTPVAFVPGAQSLVAGSSPWSDARRSQNLRVFDLATGHAQLLGPDSAAVGTLATTSGLNPILPGTSVIVTGSGSSADLDGHVCVWNSDTWQLHSRIRLPHRGPIWHLAISPNSSHLALNIGRRLFVVDLSGDKVVWDEEVGEVFSLAYSHDGHDLWMGVGSMTVPGMLWSGRDIERRSAVTGQLLAPRRGHRDLVASIVFSPDGQHVASASFDKTIKIWDVHQERTPLTLTGHMMWVMELAYSPDGRTLASASADGTVKLWDPTTGDELATLNCPFGVASVAFSPDGKTLAAGHTDQSISVWHSELEKQSWPQRLY